MTSFNEIKAHPFFSSIDWEGLIHGEVAPPPRASVDSPEASQLDASFYLSPEFEGMLSLGFTFRIDTASLRSVISP